MWGHQDDHYLQVVDHYLQVESSLQILALVESMKLEGRKKKNISILTSIQTPRPLP